MSARADLPTSYAELRRRRRDGQAPPAIGPCAIRGCRARGPAVRFGYDHCHEHDYPRGAVCHSHNGRMALADAQLAQLRQDRTTPLALAAWHDEPELVAHWSRCPRCLASFPAVAQLEQLWPGDRWANVVTRVILVNVARDPRWLSVDRVLARVNAREVRRALESWGPQRPDYDLRDTLRRALGDPAPRRPRAWPKRTARAV